MSNPRSRLTASLLTVHDLHGQTLLRLKRLMELVRANGGKLSVILAGHPKLTNDLRRASMEEIGSRTMVFMLDSIKGEQKAYITWLLEQCTQAEQPLEELITDEAMALLVERLSTPIDEAWLHRQSLGRGAQCASTGNSLVSPRTLAAESDARVAT